jgi:hypothetical protein
MQFEAGGLGRNPLQHASVMQKGIGLLPCARITSIRFKGTFSVAAVVRNPGATPLADMPCGTGGSIRSQAPRKVRKRQRPGNTGALSGRDEAAQASESAQMLRAQAIAYSPSSALAAVDRPPEPGTVSMVFCAAS